MIDLSTSLNHYKKPEVQEALVEHAANKELAVKFSDVFGKRPSIIQYPSEVFGFARQKATSFHISEEIWSNPLDIETGMLKKQLDELRTGWDLVLDVDCKFIEYSKIAANAIVEFLKKEGAGNVSLKFSGNNGFHIGLPYESFPGEIHGRETRLLFPEVTKRVALYIKERTENRIGGEILESEGGAYNKIYENVKKDVDVPFEKIIKKLGDGGRKTLDVSPFLGIDTILLSSRHLYRMPYSLHEKSGLVSLPLEPGKVMGFSKDMADPGTVEVGGIKFLDRAKSEPGEALGLFQSAIDATSVPDEPEKKSGKTYEALEGAVPEEFFPVCIKKILEGVGDGRKRAMFVLVNFLSSCGWGYEMIEKRLREWNQKNHEPLREVNLVGQLRYVKNRKSFLPPNCSNDSYYRELQVKCPEEVCSKVRNPVVFARRRSMNVKKSKKKPGKKVS